MSNQTQSKRGRKYDQNFKQQVLQTVHGGQSVETVARELRISESIIY